MSDVRGVAVTDDVGGPLVLSRVGVTRADVAGLQGLEVLEGAELVGHLVGCLDEQKMNGSVEDVVK